eukprot:Nitzschia sp. Nitz4//scaffold37_size175936//46004//47650//NITZ4_002036-RA/size175936-processed-gene-0.38-mRNA-1//1//CDS//3329549758//1848//frame0
MVAIANKKHVVGSKRPLFRGVRMQTISLTTTGILALLLLSLEPRIVLHDEVQPSYNDSWSLFGIESSLQSYTQNPHSLTIKDISKPVSLLRPPGQASSATRYGMVPRQNLRTPELKPSYPTIFANPNTKTHPRIVSLDILSWDDTLESSMLQNARTTTSDDSQSSPFEFAETPYSNTTSERIILPYEEEFYNDCEPKVELNVHPTCNALHEYSMLDETISLLSTRGSWRTAWNVYNNSAVLKILHWEREFDTASYEQHAVDVVVSDLLTASPYVVDAFGFCGQSILQEWAPSGGRDYVKDYDVRNRERLRIARDLARGLADIQALRPLPHDEYIHMQPKDVLPYMSETPQVTPPTLVFAHNDINIANTIQKNGRLKWNDFNIGVLLRSRKSGTNNSTSTTTSNTTTPEECGAPVLFRADLWRSPEEILNTSYVSLEATDMYGFGNILYQVMTRHQPWTHKEPEGQLTVEQVADRKRRGGLPTIPEQYKNTTNKDLTTMLLATMTSYHPNPRKRLTAYELAYVLGVVYDRLSNKRQVGPQQLRQLFVKS